MLGAFAFVAGYVGTNLLTELARRSSDDETLRSAVRFSGAFDQRVMVPGATLVALAGLASAIAGGYPLTSGWIVLPTIGFIAVAAVGIVMWGRIGRGIEAALVAGDIGAARALLTEPRLVLASRIENVVVVLIVALMVLRWP